MYESSGSQFFRTTARIPSGPDTFDESRLEFLAKNFALSEVEDNTSRTLNRGGIANLPLFRTLLAI